MKLCNENFEIIQYTLLAFFGLQIVATLVMLYLSCSGEERNYLEQNMIIDNNSGRRKGNKERLRRKSYPADSIHYTLDDDDHDF
jgi:hypothetical protein